MLHYLIPTLLVNSTFGEIIETVRATYLRAILCVLNFWYNFVSYKWKKIGCFANYGQQRYIFKVNSIIHFIWNWTRIHRLAYLLHDWLTSEQAPQLMNEIFHCLHTACCLQQKTTQENVFSFSHKMGKRTTIMIVLYISWQGMSNYLLEFK